MRRISPTTGLLGWLFLIVFILGWSGGAGVTGGTGEGDGAHAAPRAQARNIVLAGNNRKTSFTVSLTGPVDFSVFALADPYRVVIDLPEIEFTIPAISSKALGLVKAYRFGLFSSGKSRIVIDTRGPVAIGEPAISGKAGQTRLELVFSPTSRSIFLRDFALNGRMKPATSRAAPTVSALITALARQSGGGQPTIVIDPGHGGIDSGTSTRAGKQEKDIVLVFARRLRDRLAATGRYTVMLTRATDRFIALGARREMARKAGAELFISVHADSIRTSSVRGSTVYTLSDKASDEVAAALAAKENKSDLIAGVPLEEVSVEVSDILIDLAQRETNNLSVEFSALLVSRLKRKIRLNKNPHRSARFVVLKAPDVPSVLLELGYLSNRKDAGAIGSPRWQARATLAISEAVGRYFNARLAQAR